MWSLPYTIHTCNSHFFISFCFHCSSRFCQLRVIPNAKASTVQDAVKRALPHFFPVTRENNRYSYLVTDRGIWLKTSQNDTEWHSMTQNDSEWLRMTQNDSECESNDSEWLKMTCINSKSLSVTQSRQKIAKNVQISSFIV